MSIKLDLLPSALDAMFECIVKDSSEKINMVRYTEEFQLAESKTNISVTMERILKKTKSSWLDIFRRKKIIYKDTAKICVSQDDEKVMSLIYTYFENKKTNLPPPFDCQFKLVEIFMITHHEMLVRP